MTGGSPAVAGHSSSPKRATVRKAIELLKKQTRSVVATAKTRDYVLAYLSAKFLHRSIRIVDTRDVAVC